MRLSLTFVVFVIVGPTVAGILLTGLLSTDAHGLSVTEMFAPVAGLGFLIGLPISYVIAGSLMKRLKSSQGAA
ncbi:MAG: hypothetical protein ACFCUN_06435 [Hyphomicrobiaceae bacterium]